MNSDATHNGVLIGRDPDLPEGPKREDSFLSYFVVRLENSLYGFEAEDVDHIEAKVLPVRVPTAPAHYLGIAHLRGRIVTLIDLRKILGLPHSNSDSVVEAQRLVVLESGGVQIGVPVNEVLGLRDVPEGEVRSTLGARAPLQFLGEEDARSIQFDVEDGAVTVLGVATLISGLRGPSA